MLPLYSRMAALVQAGRRFALATVVRTSGSTPQIVGAKLVVADDGERPFGTLGGGCVEADAILTARDVLAGAPASLRAYQLNEDLAWNTGLVCGGTMWILVEPGVDALSCGGVFELEAACAATAGGDPIAFVSWLERDGQRVSHRARSSVHADGRLSGTLGEPALDRRAVDVALEQMRHGTPRTVSLGESGDLLVEPVTGRPHLVLVGGGHVARAIARQGALLDFDVTIFEDRPEFSEPSRFDGATVRVGDMPTSIATHEYGWQSYMVIATRGHKLDADCVMAAVRTTVPYIGVLGSRRKTVLIEGMLREQGIDDERIAAIHAPVGLDLGGRTPAEIALAVMAEITQTRYAGTGRSLRALAPARVSS